VRIPEAQDGRGHLVTTPTESPAAVCNCGADTFNRIRTASGRDTPHAPKCPAAVGDEIERLARELFDCLNTLGDLKPPGWASTPPQYLDLARLVRRKVLEARIDERKLRPDWSGGPWERIDAENYFNEKRLATLAAELAALEESEPSTAQDTNDSIP
jgi:hypothetical protein